MAQLNIKNDLQQALSELLKEPEVRKELASLFQSVLKDNAKESQQGVEQHFTRQEAAQYLRISLPTLNQREKDNTLTGYRVGSKVLYKKSELDQLLQ